MQNKMGGKLVITMPDGTKHETKGSFSYSLGPERMEPIEIEPKPITATVTGSFKFTGLLKKYPYRGKKRIREKCNKRFCKMFGIPYHYPNKRNTERLRRYAEYLMGLMPDEPASGDDLMAIGELYGVERCPEETEEAYRARLLTVARGVR